jgi:hypothetical protein
MKLSIFWIIMMLIMAGLTVPACTQAPATPTKIEPAKVEEIEGSDFKRVILTEKAAERIGLQTTPVVNEQTVRTYRLGGQIVTSPVSASDGPESGEAGALWVRVRLNESELNQVDRSQPATVLLVDDEDETGLIAEPDENPLADDAEDSDADEGVLYYVLGSPGTRLAAGQRVFVEVPLASSGSELLVVPYSAVIYGLQGETWVYTNPERLVFVRQPITIDYIEGDRAFLSAGPALGTPVVYVAAALLYGAETGVSK